MAIEFGTLCKNIKIEIRRNCSISTILVHTTVHPPLFLTSSSELDPTASAP